MKFKPIVFGLIASVSSLSGCATAPEEAGHFKFAAMSAVRDFNIGTQKIPTQLQSLQNPYGHSPFAGCEGLWREAQYLQSALAKNEGRRAGYRRNNNTFTGRFGNLRDQGVQSAVTVFTPYRGLVRQVTGAAAYEKQATVADQRARLRLGYLVGQAKAYQCPGF